VKKTNPVHKATEKGFGVAKPALPIPDPTEVSALAAKLLRYFRKIAPAKETMSQALPVNSEVLAKKFGVPDEQICLAMLYLADEGYLAMDIHHADIKIN